MSDGATFRLGVLVNPVAGLGGAAGLAGSDGAEVQDLARRRGGRPRASEAMRLALDALVQHVGIGVRLEAVAAHAPLGLVEARGAGLRTEVLDLDVPATTGPEHTEAAARALAERCDLVLFAGGDGTARDVRRGLGPDTPVLGVPGGVKMHSAVFATSARTAGVLAASVALGEVGAWSRREVVDLDEEARRAGDLRVELFGYLTVPDRPRHVQDRKIGVQTSTASSLASARGLVAAMRPGVRYALGPGATTAAVCELLGEEPTLLGVDVVEDGRIVAADATAAVLDRIMRTGDVVVVSPIGGQGFLLGRGNQQFSPGLLARLGRDGIWCVAAQEKLAALAGAPLLVDTGVPTVDAIVGGHVRCVTGEGRWAVYPVAAG